MIQVADAIVQPQLPIIVLPRATNPVAPIMLVSGEYKPLAETILVRVESAHTPEVKIRLRVPRHLKRFVRLIQYCSGDWIDLGATGEWTVTVDSFEADQGVSFIVLAESFARQARHRVAGWIGQFTLSVSLLNHAGAVVDRNKISCMVAPFIIPSPLDHVERVLVIETRLTHRFIECLTKETDRIGTDLKPMRFQDAIPSDVWAQDTALYGVAVTPEFGQSLAVISGIRGLHNGISTEPLDHNTRHHYRAQNAIVVDAAEPRNNSRWIDWYGNLEVSPPVTLYDGTVFPFGRILVGCQNELSLHPEVLGFLEAQKVQWPPVELDVSWLTIGHADELINFVPTNNKCGFKLLYPSVDVAKTILQTLISEGHADVGVFVRKAERTTVKILYDEIALSAETFKIATALQRQKRELMSELGITEEDFIELPALFRDGLPVIPNPVNSLVIGHSIIVADPLGPTINGVDRIRDAIIQPLKAVGMDVRFIDIWEPYHVRSGEIHCATNTIRRLSRQNWWEAH